MDDKENTVVALPDRTDQKSTVNKTRAGQIRNKNQLPSKTNRTGNIEGKDSGKQPERVKPRKSGKLLKAATTLGFQENSKVSHREKTNIPGEKTSRHQTKAEYQREEHPQRSLSDLTRPSGHFSLERQGANSDKQHKPQGHHLPVHDSGHHILDHNQHGHHPHTHEHGYHGHHHQDHGHHGHHHHGHHGHHHHELGHHGQGHHHHHELRHHHHHEHDHHGHGHHHHHEHDHHHHEHGHHHDHEHPGHHSHQHHDHGLYGHHQERGHQRHHADHGYHGYHHKHLGDHGHPHPHQSHAEHGFHGHSPHDNGHHNNEHGHHKSRTYDHSQHHPHSGTSKKQSTIGGWTRRTYSTISGNHRHYYGDNYSVCSACTNIAWENTYKTEPDVEVRSAQIRKIIKEVLKEKLESKTYDALEMQLECRAISDNIKDKVKALGMRRFKLVCLVFIGQESHQSVQIASRCLWDQRCDNFATATIQFGNFYATGMVFASYFE